MRSFICASVGLAMCALAWAESGTAVASGTGRYAIGQISANRQDQYMLDTQTGRIWSFVCMKQGNVGGTICNQFALQPVMFLDLNGAPSGLSPAIDSQPARQQR